MIFLDWLVRYEKIIVLMLGVGGNLTESPSRGKLLAQLLIHVSNTKVYKFGNHSPHHKLFWD